MSLSQSLKPYTSAASIMSQRKRKRERLLLFAMCTLFLSLVTIFIVLIKYRQAGASNIQTYQEPAPKMIGNVALYAAAHYIRAGSKITNADFHEILWPRRSVPEGAIRNKAALLGKYAKEDIQAGLPIESAQVVKEQRYVSLPITPGMRAVTIEVDSKSGLEGWAHPGTRVDVTLTYVHGDALTSKVIVQNAKVLSYAGDSRPAHERFGLAKQGRVTAGSTLTLEVSPGDALKIQTSRRIGSLSLLMRAPEDDQATRVLEVDKNAIDSAFQGVTQPKKCKKGTMRLDNRNYIIDCDGSISEFQG